MADPVRVHVYPRWLIPGSDQVVVRTDYPDEPHRHRMQYGRAYDIDPADLRLLDWHRAGFDASFNAYYYRWRDVKHLFEDCGAA